MPDLTEHDKMKPTVPEVLTIFGITQTVVRVQIHVHLCTEHVRETDISICPVTCIRIEVLLPLLTYVVRFKH